MEKRKQGECTIAGLYDLSETIGKGHFAVVKLARHVFTGEKVAVKVIDKIKLDPVSREHLFQEVRCMKLVQHPHIVRLYEVIDTQTKLYLILELGDGDMYDYIVDNHDKGMDMDTARMYFTQILEAISYCHALHVVHRDLKPENVIFFEKSGIVKLTDFGFSNRFEPNTKLDTSCGSLAYSAPEILLGDSYDAPAVDVWSLGVLLFMLVSGEPPFQEANDSETLTMIMDVQFRIPPHVPTECASLINSMLRREPKERLPLDQIISHPWMKNKSDGKQCCTEALCTALVSREHLSQEEVDCITQKMVDGGIASKTEILRALDADEYSHITATFYLLVERKLKKQHTERVTHLRQHTSRPPKLDRSLSQPGVEPEFLERERDNLPPMPHSAPYDSDTSSVFSSQSSSNMAAHEVQTDPSALLVLSETIARKFSLISEEDEEYESDDLNDSVLTVKEIRSATLGHHSTSSSLASLGKPTQTPSQQDFEQSLSSMSLRRQLATPTLPPLRPLRSVTSSPQLLPLKQIHEEGESATAAEDDTMPVPGLTKRARHSCISMTSPELARKILTKQSHKRTASGSEETASDNDEERNDIVTCMCSLPLKRKEDGSDYSSDTDGPTINHSRNRSPLSSSNHMTGLSKPDSSLESPTPRKKYSQPRKSSHEPPSETSTNSSHSSLKAAGIRSSSANNNGKDDNSLRVMASKLMDTSIARLSNFSLASQSSSLSSKSSKYSTPRSSQRRSKDPKFPKIRLITSLNNKNFEFSELSDHEMELDSDSLSSSRVKVVLSSSPECGKISEESPSDTREAQKKGVSCCRVM